MCNKYDGDEKEVFDERHLLHELYPYYSSAAMHYKDSSEREVINDILPPKVCSMLFPLFFSFCIIT